MDAKAPVRVIPVHCAPKKAPCPCCGTLARRQRTLQGNVRTIAYKEIAVLRISYGEYEARCGWPGAATPPGADEQSRGALQPQAAILGEGALQMASPPDAGALCGSVFGPMVEAGI
jgi:hypothetical protein